ncbi:tape measure protein [Paenibacillus aceti]|nr:tape measure protein [Paenibacillus aceti]
MTNALALFDSAANMRKPVFDAPSPFSLPVVYEPEVTVINPGEALTSRLEKPPIIIDAEIIPVEDEFKENIEASAKAQDKLGEKTKKNLEDIVKAFKIAKAAVKSISSAMDFSDAYVNTFARLDMINDHLQTTQKLQDKVFASAQRSRGNYMEAAAEVSQLGQMAPDAFNNNDEMIAFHELAQQSIRMGGGDQKSGMNNLTKMMAAGSFSGGDFSSMVEYAPMLAQAVSDYTGKSREELVNLSSSGVLSSDVIKNAMFAASDQINEKFSEFPQTFGDHFNSIKNTAIRGLDPIIQKLSELLNSPGVSSFFSGLETGLSVVMGLINMLIDGAIWLGQVAQTHWPIMEQTLTTLAALIPLLIVQLWGMVSPILTAVGAWMMANWQILLVAAIIGLLVAAMIHFGISAEEVIGAVVGAFFALYAIVYNIIVGIINAVVQFAESTVNLFFEAIYYVKKLIYDLAIFFIDHFYNMLLSVEEFAGGFMTTILSAINGALKGFNWFVDGVNNIFGTSFKTAELFDENNIHALSDKVNSIRNSLEEPVKTEVDFGHIAYKDVGENYDKGKSIGINGTRKMMDGANKFKNSLTDKFKNPTDGLDISSSPYKPASQIPGAASSMIPGLNSIPNVGKVDKVGQIENSVDISSEDLKMMRELAEMKSIQNFVSLTPTVQVTTGPVNNGADIDTIVARIEQTLEEEIAASAAGVYG